MTFVKENLHGQFRILNTCISCAACWKHAPLLIKSHDIDAYAFFFKQPETKDEFTLAYQAIHLCPVNAIIDIENEETQPK
jgi:ferredoxin